MYQKPSWEANSLLASEETPRLLWNPKVHCLIHKSPPLIPVLSQIDPAHTLTSSFFKIHFNIILSSTPRSPKWSHPFRFSVWTFVGIFLSLSCVLHILSITSSVVIILYIWWLKGKNLLSVWPTNYYNGLKVVCLKQIRNWYDSSCYWYQFGDGSCLLCMFILHPSIDSFLFLRNKCPSPPPLLQLLLLRTSPSISSHGNRKKHKFHTHNAVSTKDLNEFHMLWLNMRGTMTTKYVKGQSVLFKWGMGSICAVHRQLHVCVLMCHEFMAILAKSFSQTNGGNQWCQQLAVLDVMSNICHLSTSECQKASGIALISYCLRAGRPWFDSWLPRPERHWLPSPCYSAYF